MERNENFDNNQLERTRPPHDTISQGILSRFPIETIYSSVCKLWCSLPGDPMFVDPHLHQSRQASNLIVMCYKVENHMHTILSFYSIEVLETGNIAKLIFTVSLEVDLYSMEPSVNGLVCFSALTSKKIYICNPSTRKLLQLPNVGSGDAGSEPDLSVLAGFGFDSSAGAYKVLRAFVSEHRGGMKWFIYTVGSRDASWREVNQLLTTDHRIQPAQNAYNNGVLHWICQRSENSVPFGILTFDFRDEMFRLLPLPNCPSWRTYLSFGKFHAALRLKVIGGCLQLIAILGGPFKVILGESGSPMWGLRIWTLRDYERHEWTDGFGFHIDILNRNMKLYMPVPVDIQNGKLLFSFGSKLYYSDGPRTGTATEINDGIPKEDCVETMKQCQANFKESLVPISFIIREVI